MARNAYDTRLDILRLARDILSENSHARRQTEEEQRNRFFDARSIELSDEGTPVIASWNILPPPDGDMHDRTIEFDPHTYTADDVLDLARKLDAFVSGEDAPQKS